MWNSQLSCRLFVNQFNRCWSFLYCCTGSCTKLGSAWDTFSNFPNTYLSSSHMTCLAHCSWAPCAPPVNISPCVWCLSKKPSAQIQVHSQPDILLLSPSSWKISSLGSFFKEILVYRCFDTQPVLPEGCYLLGSVVGNSQIRSPGTLP